VLKLPDSWSADALRDHAKIIEQAIADVLGVPLAVRLRIDGSGAAGAPPNEDDADVLFDYANQRIR
jgi:hypothetical protein